MELSILLKRGYSHRDIGDALGKDHSSIGREISNNGVKGTYDPHKAHHKALVRRLHSKYKGMKVRDHPELEKYIAEKLRAEKLDKDHYWIPEQIAGRWNREVHRDQSDDSRIVTISPPSIYKYLYSSYGQHLCGYLPSQRYHSKKRDGKKKQKRQNIPNRKSIEERPDTVDQRKDFGHWEGDTLGRIKSDQEAITGAVERLSRYIRLKKVSRLKYAMDGFKEQLNPHHRIIRSLTLDNGVENIRYEELNVDTYFCHPYSSYEKGSVENSFLRLRRFIPKKTSLRNYNNTDIANIVNIMNNTPRKCLNYRTPKEVFEEQCKLLEKPS
jgi:IS30 family transposase